MSARYAIYFAPLAGSDLARFGDRWLGRGAETGQPVPRPVFDGLDADRLRVLTEAPRRYGFHGTLKPPFRLAEGCNVEDLRRAMAGFAKRQTPFEIAALRLREIGEFLALVPADPLPALSRLADACVTEFDAYRAPADAAELARRHAAGVTVRQAELLARWGYPYVLDEFRFHLTLTGPVTDPTERARIAALLSPLAAPIAAQPMPVRELCLFHQPDRTALFRLTDRYPFAS